MRVVFMGTPDIAATCLKQILADGFEVVGVYTQPDRPKGRGMKMVYSDVKEVALANNLPEFFKFLLTRKTSHEKQISNFFITIFIIPKACYQFFNSISPIPQFSFTWYSFSVNNL